MRIGEQGNGNHKSLIREKQENADKAVFYARLKSMDVSEVLEALAMVKSGRMDRCIDYIPEEHYSAAKDALMQFIGAAERCKGV